MTKGKVRGGLCRDRHSELLSSLAKYEASKQSLPGIRKAAHREAWVQQIISSLRRIEFISVMHQRDVAPNRIDPHSPLFDPLKGAVFLMRKGEIDEAIWLTFIATHFGKHASDGWILAANVFGSFGKGPIWTFERYTKLRGKFELMLKSNQLALSDPNISGRFSNHRQYQSKKAELIAHVFQTFHSWMSGGGGLISQIREIHKKKGQDPTVVFDELYRSMSNVYGFGRLGKFDFLTMIGKLQLAPVKPGSSYMQGATGPLAGAKLLFHGDTSAKVSAAVLGKRVDEIDDYLKIGKQVLEDSLCNWQKHPDRFVYFRG
jgi:hypothetical protein